MQMKFFLQSRNVVLYTLFTVMSLISLVIAAVVLNKMQKYQISNNKRAFFQLRDLILASVPNLQAIVFTEYTLFLAYYVYSVIKQHQKRDKLFTINDVQYKEQKQLSNLVLTELFIYLTQGLAICMSIALSFQSFPEFDSLQKEYRASEIQNDQDVLQKLKQRKAQIYVVVVFNFLFMCQLLLRTIINCCRYYVYSNKIAKLTRV